MCVCRWKFERLNYDRMVSSAQKFWYRERERAILIVDFNGVRVKVVFFSVFAHLTNQ